MKLIDQRCHLLNSVVSWSLVLFTGFSYIYYKNTTDVHYLNYLLEEGDRPGRKKKKKITTKKTKHENMRGLPLNEVRNAHICTPQYVQQPELAWLTQQVPVTSRGFFSFYSQEWQKSLCTRSIRKGQKGLFYVERVLDQGNQLLLLLYLNSQMTLVNQLALHSWRYLATWLPLKVQKTWHLWLILPSLPEHLTEMKVCKRVGVISPSLDGVCKT